MKKEKKEKKEEEKKEEEKKKEKEKKEKKKWEVRGRDDGSGCQGEWDYWQAGRGLRLASMKRRELRRAQVRRRTR